MLDHNTPAHAGDGDASETTAKFQQELLQNPKMFSRTLLDKFSVIDTDGNNTLSRGELEQFANRPDTDQKTKAATKLALQRFEGVRDLATPNFARDGYTSGGGYGAYARVFGNDSHLNAITRQDLSVIEFISSPDKIDSYQKNLRRSETWHAIGFSALGVVLAGSGLVVSVGCPFGAIIGVPLTAIGAGSFYASTNDMRRTSSKALADDISARDQMLKSWGFRTER